MTKPRWTKDKLLATALASYAVAGGLLSLTGWQLGVARLTDWWETGITIKANTALCLVLAGSSVLLLALAPAWRGSIRWMAAIAGIVGAATLAEHAFDLNLGIDTLLFEEQSGAAATAAPGRMGPPAALSFALLAGAVWRATGTGRSALSIALPLVALTISALSMIGYAYGAESMYTAPRLTGIAVQTATMLAALAGALLCAQPARQPLQTLFEDSTTGELARRVIPLAIGLPVLLGWARVAGERAGYFEAAFGTALRTSVEIILLVATLWWVIQLARARDQQQREADRRKDEFLATLAHELRNPLAPIRAAAALSRRPQVPESQRQWSLEVIDRQVRHMSLLLDDLLDISRITRGKLELRRADVSLAAVIESAVETSRPLIDQKKHTLAIAPHADAIINVDTLRISQIVSNLLNNAAKYTPEGGRIELSATLVDGDLRIEVLDNGIGIAAEELESVFGMFTQTRGARGHSEGGLGIGLALARGLARLHGGTVKAGSAGPERGSTFTVYLPAVARRTAGQAPTPS